MTVSSNYSFDPQADQITTTALVMAQMLHPGHEAEAGLLEHGRNVQNLAAKAIANDGGALVGDLSDRSSYSTNASFPSG